MEKFSAYRDPGTGIQPFLVPVPPTSAPSILQLFSRLLGSILSVLRLAILFFIVLLYLILVEALCLLFIPIPPLYHALARALTFVLAKLALWSIGIYWIPVETTTRKRTGRHARQSELWNPSAGDLIISNWASWIEILWLAAHYNPIFVLPVPESLPQFEKTTLTSAPTKSRPGRATGTGSANIQSPQKHSAVPSVPITRFREVSLLRMICITGRIPPYFTADSGARPLEEIRRSSKRPVVVFPECTTSNGRGILRFSGVFNQEIPVRGYQVFIMCVRYDPPTAFVPTLTRPVALAGPACLNPISHIFQIAHAITTSAVSIRLLAPSESPSSQLFIASDYIKGSPGEDQLAEASANLISQIGRLKRTGMGWEDKASFLHYRNLKQG